MPTRSNERNNNVNDLNGILTLPPDPAGDIRLKMGLKSSDELRVSFIPGPGDVAGTFARWQIRQHDRRVPTIAYSLMFYEVMSNLNAKCQIVSLQPFRPSANNTGTQFRFEHVAVLPSKDRWSYIRSRYLFSRKLVQAVERHDPHIVVTSTHNPASSWKKLTKNRTLVLTAHNTFWPMGRPRKDLKGRLAKALLSSQATAIDAAICTSHECARQIADLTKGRIRGEVQCPQIVAHYPIEKRNEVKKLLFLGRVEHSKGVLLLLDVFDRLAKRYPDLSLVIAGSGSADADLKTRTARSSYQDRITLAGKVGSVEVHSFIASSDLLVCPTMQNFNEGLAVVGFEGAAHGIPTVLSSVVPALELLGEGCTVFEADNPTALHDALTNLIDDPPTYRKRCAATAAVREKIYDRSLSWGSGLFRALLKA